jgi:hypothetical protein
MSSSRLSTKRKSGAAHHRGLTRFTNSAQEEFGAELARRLKSDPASSPGPTPLQEALDGKGHIVAFNAGWDTQGRQRESC